MTTRATNPFGKSAKKRRKLLKISHLEDIKRSLATLIHDLKHKVCEK